MTLQINSLIAMISILVSVAFYTILERKLLSYIQMRKGPNKVGFMGLLQPFSDAIKLFNKSLIQPTSSNKIILFSTPFLTFILSLMMWPIMPLSHHNILDSPFNTLIFIVLSSLTVYTILTIGWSANSKYSHLGSIRSIAQMISYEINFFLLILFMLLLFHSYSMKNFLIPQISLMLIPGTILIFYIWMTTCIAEVNRSPFDFAEGESELVSGFNVEFMGGMFALIFLAEYTNMILLSMITTIFFTGLLLTPLSIVMMILLTSLLLWVRGTFPRFRYDLLMNLNWKIFLPITTILIFPMTLYSFSNF